jgi:hypothetical protein
MKRLLKTSAPKTYGDSFTLMAGSDGDGFDVWLCLSSGNRPRAKQRAAVLSARERFKAPCAPERSLTGYHPCPERLCPAESAYLNV